MKNEIGVRQLVEFVWQTGDLHGEIFNSDNTALQGSAIHRQLQKSWNKNFIAEFDLKLPIQIGNKTYTIHGRADGVHQTDSNYDKIIEIKTSSLPFDVISKAKLSLYWAQLKIYAALLMKKSDITKIELELIYFQTSSNKVTHERNLFTKEEAESFFTKTLNIFGEWIKLKQNMLLQRNNSIRNLHFPFAQYRPHQHELAAAVYKTIVFHKRLFVEAPTGTGKTISTLFPAVMSLGQNKTERIFYLTAKESTRQVAEQSLLMLQEKGLYIHSITLTAKEKITFEEEKNIEDDRNPYFVGYYDRLKPALTDILQNEHIITAKTLKKYARKHLLDPFEFSLDISLFCDIVISDYNYLFDPLVYLQRFFQDSSKNYCFLIDEAHNLVARSRSMYTAEINSAPIKFLLTKIEKSHEPVSKKICTLLKRLHRSFSKLKDTLSPSKQNFLILNNCLEEFLKQVQHFTTNSQTWLKQNPDHPLFQQVLDYYFSAHAFLKISSFYDKTFRTKIKIEKEDVIVKIFCLNPSSLINRSLEKGKSSILFSATLSPITYYQDVLGGKNDSLTYTLSSPFKIKNLGIFTTPKLNVTYHFRSQNESKIIAALSTMVHAKSGNYLIFLPSYTFLEQIHAAFLRANPAVKTVCQTPDMDDTAKEIFLTTFTKRPIEKVTGFAVLGGSFAEGIDLKGDSLSGAAIITVGLPAFNEETAELENFFNQTSKNGFEYAYQLPGLNNVLQAAGRVIRGMDDIGVILLLDQRFATNRYTRYFPAHWQHYQQSYSLSQLAEQLALFWAHVNSNC
ncbi:Superfamily II DNA and RNA helicase [Liquorilactobacillus aquaticus DSM 21051]|uniref:DNA 5'-3' helicase n=1 Tax=Liquorilactobacillus aquaticus DSM 21051 TaxID=1423725 RepID=A0A0R2D7G2_9LACO|nr:helicase C-terminal domain-containing protein [Liquorilactobacillus aquaticus]KRM96220.1 Superfamily II DNA and RNA helicase [Liquorilactobacillus aquaticus DSM 21051]